MNGLRVGSGALLVLWLAGCGRGEAPAPIREANGTSALEMARIQMEFGPRVPGTPGHAAMADWLDSLSRTMADSVVTTRWIHLSADGDSLPMVNVMASFNPSAPRRILYLAHWDTRPRADAAGSSDSSAVVPGANDGASGVAVLLEVMRVLDSAPPELGVDLLFVDGEDYGHFTPEQVDVLIGSKHYAAGLAGQPKPEFAVVWDMVGAGDARFAIEAQSAVAAPNVIELVWGVAHEMGYGHFFIRSSGGGIVDDHVPLIEAGVRAIDVIGFPYPHWHTPDDTFDKLSAATLEAVSNVAVAVIRRAGIQ